MEGGRKEDGVRRSVQPRAGYVWCANYIDLLIHASPRPTFVHPIRW